MPQSLRRTWALLGLASLAVLFVAFLTGRDFVRDVYPECRTSLVAQSPPADVKSGSPSGRRPASPDLNATEPVVLDLANPDATEFQLLFDQKRDLWSTRYSNVRIVWSDASHCNCGSIPVYLSGESPYDLRLFRDPKQNVYVVKGRMDYGAASTSDDSSLRAFFTLRPAAVRHFQWSRVLTMHHLPAMVSLLAMGALVVALLRSRRAMSYALRLHAWTEARLATGGIIESTHGATLGTLERLATLASSAGPVLIAPEALATGGLYRDMPIIRRRNIAEGSHERWTRGTMLRLRDARALAIISTACTMLAFGARLVA